jgi:1-acyl-sn-glycerol-3-phosphate acyltransferase
MLYSVSQTGMKKFDDIVAYVDAVFKTAAILLLIIILIPVALAFKRLDAKHPFKIPCIFHRHMLRILGIRLRVYGRPSTASPVLFVANHASYLDIPVLGSLLPAGFVAKAEVADWPLFGLLSRMQNSIFVERRSSRAAEQRLQLQDYLAMGQNLVLFPEGTSSAGFMTMSFKSSLFGIVEDSANGKAITVQPISVTCVELGGFPMLREERPRYAWYGDMTLIPHLWAVIQSEGFTVEVIFHEPMTYANYPNRKDLAAACQRAVAKGVERSHAQHQREISS